MKNVRLRKKPWVKDAILDYSDFVRQEVTEEAKGKWADDFGRKAPLHVELGCGKGDFITGMAARHRVYINFCDPWPKARHAKRRLTYRTFLERYKSLLKQGGAIHFKTDNRPLFDFSLEEFAEVGCRVEDISFDLHSEDRPDNIRTEYEEKFSAKGFKINRCEISFD